MKFPCSTLLAVTALSVFFQEDTFVLAQTKVNSSKAPAAKVNSSTNVKRSKAPAAKVNSSKAAPAKKSMKRSSVPTQKPTSKPTSTPTVSTELRVAAVSLCYDNFIVTTAYFSSHRVAIVLV